MNLNFPPSNRPNPSDVHTEARTPSIVGSPDQSHQTTETSTSHHWHAASPDGQQTPHRPYSRIGPRGSHSSSATAPSFSRILGQSRTQRITSMLLSPASSPRDEPWSLFGQMMENESPLRSANHTRTPFQGSSSSIPHVVDQGDHALAASQTDQQLGVQSPMSDPFMEAQEYFPAIPTPPSRLSEISNDYESDSSTSSEQSSRVKPSSWWSSPQRFPQIPRLYKNILKCGIAYFIASLFTFSPYLSRFIADITPYGPGNRRPSPSGHMVATV